MLISRESAMYYALVAFRTLWVVFLFLFLDMMSSFHLVFHSSPYFWYLILLDCLSLLVLPWAAVELADPDGDISKNVGTSSQHLSLKYLPRCQDLPRT